MAFGYLGQPTGEALVLTDWRLRLCGSLRFSGTLRWHFSNGLYQLNSLCCCNVRDIAQGWERKLQVTVGCVSALPFSPDHSVLMDAFCCGEVTLKQSDVSAHCQSSFCTTRLGAIPKFGKMCCDGHSSRSHYCDRGAFTKARPRGLDSGY